MKVTSKQTRIRFRGVIMARARNIKPSFFDNDLLAENEPLGRLLFIGLWTLADHNGNLEWRDKRIKKQVLAYDNCDIRKLAINLDKSGFIRFYSDGDKIFVNIVNFEKHQNPHKNERDKGTDIPEYSEDMRQVIDLKGLTINHDKSRLKQECSTSDPADSLFLIPDSPILNPESSFPIPDCQTDAKAPNTNSTQVKEIFDHWKMVMKKNESSKLTKERDKKIRERLKEGYTVEQIKFAIDGCANSPHNMGQNENGKIYDDLELICRTGSHVERFAGYNQEAQPQRFSGVSARNLQTIDNWVPPEDD